MFHTVYVMFHHLSAPGLAVGNYRYSVISVFWPSAVSSKPHYLLFTYSTTQPWLSCPIFQAMIAHYSTCISYHVEVIHFCQPDPQHALPFPLCITSRAQNIFRQAMRRPVILFHIVPASLKRQYELLAGPSELSPPPSNRVRFSQDSQQPRDRSSLVGGQGSRGGATQPGLNNT